METALFVAKMLAIVYLSIGLGLMISKDYYQKELPRIIENSGIIYLGGFIAIVSGLAIIELHNIWTRDWTVLITVVGWLALVKGVLLLIFPKFLVQFKSLYKPENLNIFMFIYFALGLICLYFGFFKA